MPRRPRYHVPGDFYHVIARGNQQQDIFRQEDDYLRYLSYLAIYAPKYAVKVHAYALMTNHVHLIVQEGDHPLGLFMKGVQQGYAQYVNKRYEQTGHLFQGRYKAFRIDGDQYLLTLVRYIHLNPVNAGLVQNPADYRWSSHRHYYSGSGEGVVETAEIRGLMEEYKNTEIGDYQLLPEMSRRLLVTAATKRSIVVDTHEVSPSDLMPLPEIMRRVVAHTGIPTEEIIGPRQDQQTKTARWLFIWEAIEAGHPLVDLARYLGRSRAAITKAAQSIQADLQSGGPWAGLISSFRN